MLFANCSNILLAFNVKGKKKQMFLNDGVSSLIKYPPSAPSIYVYTNVALG